MHLVLIYGPGYQPSPRTPSLTQPTNSLVNARRSWADTCSWVLRTLGRQLAGTGKSTICSQILWEIHSLTPPTIFSRGEERAHQHLLHRDTSLHPATTHQNNIDGFHQDTQNWYVNFWLQNALLASFLEDLGEHTLRRRAIVLALQQKRSCVKTHTICQLLLVAREKQASNSQKSHQTSLREYQELQTTQCTTEPYTVLQYR